MTGKLQVCAGVSRVHRLNSLSCHLWHRLWGRHGGNVPAPLYKGMIMWDPLEFLQNTAKRETVHRHTRYNFFFCTRAKITTQDKISELCSQKLQENAKSLQIGHKEGPPLSVKISVNSISQALSQECLTGL